MNAATRSPLRSLLDPRVRLLVAGHLNSARQSRRDGAGWRPAASSLAVQATRCLTASTDPAELLLPEQQQKLRGFIELLLKQNKVVNLTAVQSADEAWLRHVGDSLALLPILDRHGAAHDTKLVDVGSGAGLPGFILAVARPAWQVTLLDSIKKRCSFVEGAAKHLGVENVQIVWARAETAGRDPSLRERLKSLQNFDMAVARAVAEMRILAELAVPLVRVDGCLVAAKGPNPEAEVKAAERACETLGARLECIDRVASFAPEGQRTAVVLRKIEPTNALYPRREGRPQKRPL